MRVHILYRRTMTGNGRKCANQFEQVIGRYFKEEESLRTWTMVLSRRTMQAKRGILITAFFNFKQNNLCYKRVGYSFNVLTLVLYSIGSHLRDVHFLSLSRQHSFNDNIRHSWNQPFQPSSPRVLRKIVPVLATT